MTHDVLVVGGGPVGLTVSLALVRSGLRVLLVDAGEARPCAPEGPFELRVSAMTRAAENGLRNLGVWQRMDASRIGEFQRMHVWDAGSDGELAFDAADIGEPHLGAMLENSALTAALAECLEGADRNFEWRRGVSLQALHCEDDGVVARVGSDVVRARLVVGADGANSKVRELADLATRVRDYAQVGVVTTLRTRLHHDDTAWQRFLPGGPIALLPLPGGYGSIVWSTSPVHASELLSLPADAFNAEVAAAFEHRFEDVVWSAERAQFPLRRVEALSYVAPRVVLVGDAAHTIHPLAGQGLNLGLLDAATLAEVMAQALDSGRDPFSRATLRRYERWRKTHNLAVQNGMDWLRWVYGQRPPLLRAGRGVGMRLIDVAGPLKRKLTALASGIDGDLPAICTRPS